MSKINKIEDRFLSFVAFTCMFFFIVDAVAKFHEHHWFIFVWDLFLVLSSFGLGLFWALTKITVDNDGVENDD